MSSFDILLFSATADLARAGALRPEDGWEALQFHARSTLGGGVGGGRGGPTPQGGSSVVGTGGGGAPLYLGLTERTWIDKSGKRRDVAWDWEWWGRQIFLDCQTAKELAAILEDIAFSGNVAAGVTAAAAVMTANIPAGVVSGMIWALASVAGWVAAQINRKNLCMGVTINIPWVNPLLSWSVDSGSTI